MSGSIRMIASDVMDLLRVKHSKDVFVAECKDGASQSRRFRRMDAWVMPRSWASPGCTGYEVKVVRADFLRDQKWPEYLPLCNMLYFVAPADVISRDEVPAECGLLEVSKNCRRLVTKKRAPVRDVEIPEALFRYVLMCRTRITDESQPRDQLPHWRDWLKEKVEKQRTGWLAGQKIRELANREIREVRGENDRLQQRLYELEHIDKMLEAAGVTNRMSYQERRGAERKMIEEVSTNVTTALKAVVQAAGAALNEIGGGPDGPQSSGQEPGTREDGSSESDPALSLPA